MIAALEALAAFGVFASVPIVGAIATRGWMGATPWSARVPAAVAAGLTLWSLPLLATATLGIYRPAILGLLGWAAVACWAVTGGRRRWPSSLRTPRVTLSTFALLGGLAVAFLVYALLPADPLITGRDMAVYAAHGVAIAETGRIDVPYAPGTLAPDGTLPPGWVGLAGVYPTMPTQTVQFGHLYPTWLGQAYAATGFGGLLRLNAFMAVVAAIAVFDVARRRMPRAVAVLAVLVLALNASQVWVARNTLTETMTQLFVWTAFAVVVSSRRRSVPAMLWAGAFIGMASVVRIDSLVMVPLFLVGWFLVVVRTDDAATRRGSLLFLAGAVTLSAGAAWYYAAFTTPYFTDLAPQLRLIAYASAAAGVLYALAFAPLVRVHAGRLLGSTPFLLVAGLVTIFAAAYAYFIRPELEPFARIDAPGHPLDGTRSHVEDAMRNLGDYIGPPTVWLAVAGLVGAAAAAVRRRPTWLPPLVVIGGYSALYFWNQSIFPDHFWAIRRFVPIVVPGFLLLAAWAGARVLARFPARARSIVLAAVVVALAAQTWRAGTPLYFVAERQGSYDVMRQVVEAAPQGRPAIGLFTADGVRAVGTPLALVFGRQLPAVDAWRPEGREEVLARLATASPSEPITVFTNLPEHATALEGETLARGSVSHEVIQSTVDPVPSETRPSSFTLEARAVTGITTLGVPFGGTPTWLVDDAGFHGPEPIEGDVARWTTDAARLSIPVFGGVTGRLAIDIVAAAPAGAQVTLRIDGEVIGLVDVPADGWQGVVELPTAVPAGETIEVTLESETFVPRQDIPGSTDTRELGVLLRSVTLLPADA